MRSRSSRRLAGAKENIRNWHKVRFGSVPGWRSKISVAEIAMGESRNIWVERRRSVFPARDFYSSFMPLTNPYTFYARFFLS